MQEGVGIIVLVVAPLALNETTKVSASWKTLNSGYLMSRLLALRSLAIVALSRMNSSILRSLFTVTPLARSLQSRPGLR